jgi:putative FmdB family regulatory protein
MPIYEYVCPEGHDRFEKLSPMSKGEAANCPVCGEVSPRVISVFSARVAVGAGVGPGSAPVAGGGASCACGSGCC